MRSRLIAFFAWLALAGLLVPWAGAADDDAPAAVPGLVATLKGHREPVYAVVYTPDGQQLVTGSGDPSVKVWTAGTGKEIKSFGGLNGHKNLVLAVAVHPDGNLFATGGSDNTAKLWDFPTRKHLKEFAAGDDTTAVAARLDGKQVAAGTKGGRVKTFDEAGKQVLDLAAHQGAVTGLAFSPNGQMLVSAGADKMLRFWAVVGGKSLGGYEAHGSAIRGVAFRPNGAAVYSAGADGTLKAWTLPPIATRALPALAAAARGLAVSNDGSQVATVVGTGIRVNNLGNGNLIRELKDAPADINGVAMAPNNAYVAAGAGKQLVLWQTKDNKIAAQPVAHSGNVAAVAFHPTSDRLLTGGADGKLKLWAVPPGVGHVLTHADAVRSAVTTDGKRLFTGGADKIVRAWNLANPKAPERQYTGHTAAVNAVAVSPAGAFLASAGDDETIRFWNQAKNEPTNVVGAHAGPIVSLVYSPNGQQVLTASTDGTLKVWQVPTIVPKMFAHAGAVSSAALSPDGTKLATGCADKQVRLWNLTTGASERTFTGPTLGVLSVAYLPAADRIAAGSADKSLYVWTASNAKEVHKFLNLTGTVNVVAISPDGQSVAAGLSDGTARLFSLKTGKEVQKFAGHTGAVNAILFNAKGDQVISAGADGIVQVWNPADGKGVRPIKHGSAIATLALSKDGFRLASGGADKAVKIWTLADGKPAGTVTTPAEVRSLAFAADAKRLVVAGGDKKARIYGVDGMFHEFVGHDAAVNAVVFAVDGKGVFTAGDDKMARTWPLSLVWQARHAGPVHQAVFAAGAKVISAGDDKNIRIWNAADGKAAKAIAAHKEGVLALAASADGTKVASVGGDEAAKLWDLNAKPAKEGDQPILTLALPAKPLSIAMSPNGQRLAVGVAAGKPQKERVHVYDVKGSELQVLGEADGAPARSLAFLADNRTLVAAGSDKTARLTDVQAMSALDAHKGGVTSIVYHTNGTQALTGGADKTIKLWNLTTGKLEKTFGPMDDAVDAVAFARDGTLAAAAGGKTVKAWTVTDGKEALSLAQPSALYGLAISGDKTRLATAGADGRTRVWDIAGKREMQAFPHDGPVRGVAFHPSNNAQVVSASDDKTTAVHTVTLQRAIANGSGIEGLALSPNQTHVLTAGTDGKARLWNTGNGLLERTCLGGKMAATCVAVSRNTQLIASGGADGLVRVYGYNDGKLLASIKAPAAVRDITFDPNNQALVASCSDGSLATWDAVYNPGQPLAPEFGKLVQTYKQEKPGGISFPTAGAIFYSAGDGMAIRSWKLPSDSPIRSFPHPNSVNAVAFNKDGGMVATGCSDGRLRIFDVAKGTVVKEIIAHPTVNLTAIYCVAWMPDGKQVVTGSVDQTLKLWNVADGKLVREFKAYKEKVFDKGHQEAVLCAVISADGKQMFSGGMDKNIKVWNMADGSVTRDLVNPAFDKNAHPGWVYALRFSPDGKTLYSAGGAPKLRGHLSSWNVADGKLLDGRELNVGTIFSLAIGNDGKQAVIGTGGSVRSPELSQGLILKLPLPAK
jgi:WD40 repeat protein